MLVTKLLTVESYTQTFFRSDPVVVFGGSLTMKGHFSAWRKKFPTLKRPSSTGGGSAEIVDDDVTATAATAEGDGENTHEEYRALPIAGMQLERDAVDHNDEVEDEAIIPEEDLPNMEEHKSVLMHLVSQLKLGMDLTKVTLPTFILEKRSLLEFFADSMTHPQLFLKIADESSPEERMNAVVKWFLTSFHSGRGGCVAKKPYNPILGETFHCSWRVCDADQREHLVFYCAEQVSHHPPVTAFYFQCASKRIYLNASLHTKSKFQGVAVCVAMIGHMRLHVLEHQEEYNMRLPTVYARSLLTIPWVELCDKVDIHCPQSGYNASLHFLAKPFYGGKIHKVKGQVKDPNHAPVTDIRGQWNDHLEFHFLHSNVTRAVTISELEQSRKRVRPVSQQMNQESRRLWQQVTDALKCGNYTLADQHKRELEQRQRNSEKWRNQKQVQLAAKYFVKVKSSNASEEDCWQYLDVL